MNLTEKSTGEWDVLSLSTALDIGNPEEDEWNSILSLGEVIAVEVTVGIIEKIPPTIIYFKRKAILRGIYAIPVKEDLILSGKFGVKTLVRPILKLYSKFSPQVMDETVAIIQSKLGMKWVIDESLKTRGQFNYAEIEETAKILGKFVLDKIDESIIVITGEHLTLKQMEKKYYEMFWDALKATDI